MIVSANTFGPGFDSRQLHKVVLIKPQRIERETQIGADSWCTNYRDASSQAQRNNPIIYAAMRNRPGGLISDRLRTLGLTGIDSVTMDKGGDSGHINGKIVKMFDRQPVKAAA